MKYRIIREGFDYIPQYFKWFKWRYFLAECIDMGGHYDEIITCALFAEAQEVIRWDIHNRGHEDKVPTEVTKLS